jgi:anhydro-N-acetylmuramic acid kinase
MLADGYFALAPPKSTGREYFGAPFLDRFGLREAWLGFDDGCATLAALTADSIARDVAHAAPEGARVVAAGGGVHNAAVMRRLAERLGSNFDVVTSAARGVDPDAKEAIAFAVLGYELLRGRGAGLPKVTGARHAALLGALAPHELEDVLARVRAETEGR